MRGTIGQDEGDRPARDDIEFSCHGLPVGRPQCDGAVQGDEIRSDDCDQRSVPLGDAWRQQSMVEAQCLLCAKPSGAAQTGDAPNPHGVTGDFRHAVGKSHGAKRRGEVGFEDERIGVIAADDRGVSAWRDLPKAIVLVAEQAVQQASLSKRGRHSQSIEP